MFDKRILSTKYQSMRPKTNEMLKFDLLQWTCLPYVHRCSLRIITRWIFPIPRFLMKSIWSISFSLCCCFCWESWSRDIEVFFIHLTSETYSRRKLTFNKHIFLTFSRSMILNRMVRSPDNVTQSFLFAIRSVAVRWRNNRHEHYYISLMNLSFVMHTERQRRNLL